MGLRIGFDAKRFFHNHTGLGNYARTLVRNLAQYYPDSQLFLFTPSKTNIKEVNFIHDYEQIKVIEANTSFKSYWRSKGVNKQLLDLGIDIYHGLSHEIPIDKPRYPWKTIVTMHDLIHKVYPKQYKWLDRLIYERKFKYSCTHADSIIAISESTKSDITAYYKVAPEKINVLYQTCSDYFKKPVNTEQLTFVKNKYKLPNDYFIFVGSIIERKNLKNIVEAYQLLDAQERIPIVVLGSGGAHLEMIKGMLKQYKLEDLFHFKKHSSLSDLPALYAAAKALIYPSLYEGFGIPILEALYQNCPVITSKISSMPEAAGTFANLVNPHSPSDIAEKMKSVLFSRAAFNTDQIEKHLSQFESEHLTHKLVEIYNGL